MNSKFKIVLSVAVVIAIAGAYVFPKVQERFGADAGPSHLGPQEFLGGLTYGYINATSSSVATYTLTAGDLTGGAAAFYDTIVFSKTGLVATTTWTLPASSTLPHVLPVTGMRQSVCFTVATTTGNAGLILAEGTGFGLEAASSTMNQQTTWNATNGLVARTIQGSTLACGWISRGQSDTQPDGGTLRQDLVFTLTTPGEIQ